MLEAWPASRRGGNLRCFVLASKRAGQVGGRRRRHHEEERSLFWGKEKLILTFKRDIIAGYKKPGSKGDKGERVNDIAKLEVGPI